MIPGTADAPSVIATPNTYEYVNELGEEACSIFG